MSKLTVEEHLPKNYKIVCFQHPIHKTYTGSIYHLAYTGDGTLTKEVYCASCRGNYFGDSADCKQHLLAMAIAISTADLEDKPSSIGNYNFVAGFEFDSTTEEQKEMCDSVQVHVYINKFVQIDLKHDGKTISGVHSRMGKYQEIINLMPEVREKINDTITNMLIFTYNG